MPSGLDFEGWQLQCMLLFIQLFASRASSHNKYDMGALSRLNATLSFSTNYTFTHGASYYVLLDPSMC